ncbi:MAG TPA: MarR family transcriptional regulator [Thermoanaerobaculia bacterium]|jgi:DNA-binding MarR family transcriptional regulator|nr:MarR family transcriptional regulator [Thermoanaerobaculia bacterium]
MAAQPERDLVAGVIQLGNLLTRRLAPVFEKARVTPQQWAILSVLDQSGSPMSLASLARLMMVSKQNMTGMMARLEQLGFAERAGDPEDLRSSRVVLTRRGRSTVEKLRPAYEEWRSALGADLSERDLAVAAKTIEQLIAKLAD